MEIVTEGCHYPLVSTPAFSAPPRRGEGGVTGTSKGRSGCRRWRRGLGLDKAVQAIERCHAWRGKG